MSYGAHLWFRDRTCAYIEFAPLTFIRFGVRQPNSDFTSPPQITYTKDVNPAWFAQRPPRVPARGVYFL